MAFEGALRASDRGRDRVAGRLRRACAMGEIGIDTLEARLEATLRARTMHELRGITRDLPSAWDRLLRRTGPAAASPPLSVAGDALVGRSRSCDLVIRGEGVSRRHALIQRVGDGWRIADLGSMNGTYVNGVRVEAAFIEPGDQLTLGGLTFTFLPAPAPPAPPA